MIRQTTIYPLLIILLYIFPSYITANNIFFVKDQVLNHRLYWWRLLDLAHRICLFDGHGGRDHYMNVECRILGSRDRWEHRWLHIDELYLLPWILFATISSFFDHSVGEISISTTLVPSLIIIYVSEALSRNLWANKEIK